MWDAPEPDTAQHRPRQRPIALAILDLGYIGSTRSPPESAVGTPEQLVIWASYTPASTQLSYRSLDTASSTLDIASRQPSQCST